MEPCSLAGDEGTPGLDRLLRTGWPPAPGWERHQRPGHSGHRPTARWPAEENGLGPGSGKPRGAPQVQGSGPPPLLIPSIPQSHSPGAHRRWPAGPAPRPRPQPMRRRALPEEPTSGHGQPTGPRPQGPARGGGPGDPARHAGFPKRRSSPLDEGQPDGPGCACGRASPGMRTGGSATCHARPVRACGLARAAKSGRGCPGGPAVARSRHPGVQRCAGARCGPKDGGGQD